MNTPEPMPKAGMNADVRGHPVNTHASGSGPQSQNHLLRTRLPCADTAICSLDTLHGETGYNHAHASVLKAPYGVNIELGACPLDHQSMAVDRANAKGNVDRALREETVLEEPIIDCDPALQRFFQVVRHPIQKGAGESLAVVVVTRDIPELKRHERDHRRWQDSDLAMSRVNEPIAWAGSEKDLLDATCRACVECGPFDLAWIDSVMQDRTRPQFSHVRDSFGKSSRGLEIDLTPKSPESRGPSGICFLENRLVISQDWGSGASDTSWPERASGVGIRSSASVPLLQEGMPDAGPCLLCRKSSASAHVSLLEKMGEDLSCTLDTFAKEGRHRTAEAALPARESDLKPAFEQGVAGMGYEAQERARRSFQEVTHPDDRDRCSILLASVATGPEDNDHKQEMNEQRNRLGQSPRHCCVIDHGAEATP